MCASDMGSSPMDDDLFIDFKPRYLVLLKENIARLLLLRGVENAVDVLRHGCRNFYCARLGRKWNRGMRWFHCTQLRYESIRACAAAGKTNVPLALQQKESGTPVKVWTMISMGIAAANAAARQWEVRADAKYPIEPTRKLRKAKLSGRAVVRQLEADRGANRERRETQPPRARK